VPSKARRTFAIPGTCDLDELTRIVVQGFNFETDFTTYLLQVRDRYGIEQNYLSDDYDDAPLAHEIRLEELNLPEGSEIRLRFDLTHSWYFSLKVVEISPSQETLAEPVLLSGEGEAPPQYPSW
jgi:hypothetical protein